MELLTGFPLLIQQFTALLKKNYILAWRNRRATILQIMGSFFFLLMIHCIDFALDYQAKTDYRRMDVNNPAAFAAAAIPDCEDNLFVNIPCFDFVWSGPNSTRIRSIVDAIRVHNPGRPIPPEKVKYFETPDAADIWLYENQLRTTGALHLVENNSTTIGYGIQANNTKPKVKDEKSSDDPAFTYLIPLQVAAEREIARSLTGDPGFNWVVKFKEFAHPPKEDEVPTEIISTLGPQFFLAMTMFGFVFQMTSLVQERELKLRQAMSIMGLYETAYWLSWLIWETFMATLSSLLTVLFGLMFQFDFFKKNAFGVVFLLFLIFQIDMIGFAFMLSTFLSNSSSSNTIAFIVFLIAIVTTSVSDGPFFYSTAVRPLYQNIWSLFPPNLLCRGVYLLNQAIEASPGQKHTGMKWDDIAKCDHTDCTMTMKGVYIWLASTFILWFLLAIYFDNILPNPFGVRKSVFYFLKIGYWTGRGGDKMEESGICSYVGSISPPEPITPDDDDVLEEETYVKQQARDGEVPPNIAVQIRGLVKSYPGKLLKKGAKNTPFHAVKGLWINMHKDQLFCLLGANGAGKTTIISCLTGSTPVTSGDAIIYGNSVRSSIGMSQIRRIIGVCPQFDILWESLSGMEHIHLFGRLKGLSPSTIDQIAKKSLAEVKLTGASNIRSGSYSGGMKRRLSVAIALLGDPKLVILDEPTTGMDPITRRHVWDIIERAKQGRAIILTTHSMEEADILSDRIGIIAKGRLRCLGTSIRLKSKFGTGFVANVSFSSSPEQNERAEKSRAKAVKKFFKSHLRVKPKEETKAFLTFVIPRQKEDMLKGFFKELQCRQSELGISDIQIGLATLEEVFLNIAMKAELETAKAEAKTFPLTLTSGTTIQIPAGARYVAIPGTESPQYPKGLMVEIHWEQDESGAFCISGHSAETPVPQNVNMSSSPTTATIKLNKRGVVQGIPIDPQYIIDDQEQ